MWESLWSSMWQVMWATAWYSLGGITCNYTLYSDGTIDPFVGDPLAPATGPTKVRGYAERILSTPIVSLSPIDYAKNSKENITITINDGGDTDIFYNLLNGGGSGGFTFLAIPDGRVQIDFSDNLGTAYPDLYSTTHVKGVKHKIGFEFEDQGVTLDLHLLIDGVREATHAGLVKANGWSYNGWVISNSAVFPIDALVHELSTEIEGVEVKNLNFDTRLQPVEENQLKITDSINGYVMDLMNITQRFPYLDTSTDTGFGEGFNDLTILGDSNSTIANNYASLTNDYLQSIGYTDVVYNNVAVFGMTSYTFARTGTNVPARPLPDLTRNITKVLSDGNKNIVRLLGTNDITQNFTELEIQALIDNDVIDTGIAGANYFLYTMMPRASTVVGENIKANNISQYIRDTYSDTPHVYIVDVNEFMGLGGGDNFLNSALFVDDWHANSTGYKLMRDKLLIELNRIYSFSPYLVDDRYQIENECVLVPAGWALYTDAQGNYVRNAQGNLELYKIG